MSNTPLNAIVLKVAAPCNLNCTYCYEYNRGDSSWKDKPKTISGQTLQFLGKRISEYAELTEQSSFRINLHGGEPLLLGPRKLDIAIETLRLAAGNIKLNFGMQTNATLVSPEIVAVLMKHRVRVGVSLDGDAHANRARVDLKGRSSWGRAVRGLEQLRTANLVVGIQAVIDLDSDPHTTLDVLASFKPPIIELSQPFGSHDNLPSTERHRYSLADWLIGAFDYWSTAPHLKPIRVGILADALFGILTEHPKSEWFPSVPPGFLVVATDGSYEGLDGLKVVGTEGRILGIDVRTGSLQDAVNHDYIRMRCGAGNVAPECKACSIVSWCAGGYFPTRYGRGRGFDNPSVYCPELKRMFTHLAGWVNKQSGISAIDKKRITGRVEALHS